MPKSLTVCIKWSVPNYQQNRFVQQRAAVFIICYQSSMYFNYSNMSFLVSFPINHSAKTTISQQKTYSLAWPTPVKSIHCNIWNYLFVCQECQHKLVVVVRLVGNSPPDNSKTLLVCKDNLGYGDHKVNLIFGVMGKINFSNFKLP